MKQGETWHTGITIGTAPRDPKPSKTASKPRAGAGASEKPGGRNGGLAYWSRSTWARGSGEGAVMPGAGELSNGGEEGLNDKCQDIVDKNKCHDIVDKFNVL